MNHGNANENDLKPTTLAHVLEENNHFIIATSVRLQILKIFFFLIGNLIFFHRLLVETIVSVFAHKILAALPFFRVRIIIVVI